jgi:transposase
LQETRATTFCGTAPPAAVYFYGPDRGREHPANHMAGFTGFLHADGYAGYESLYDPTRTKPGPIVEVACWAHCRRKFFDVWEATGSPVAKEAIDRIATLYAIETKAPPNSYRFKAVVWVRSYNSTLGGILPP